MSIAKQCTRFLHYTFLFALNYIKFLALSALSKASPPFPKSRAARFARSAAKRNPAFVSFENVSTIMASQTFEPTFCLGNKGRNMSRARATMAYFFQLHSGIDPRKPEPGFHPYIFADQEMGGDISRSNPYVTYLNAGRPDGPWAFPVIAGNAGAAPITTPSSLRVALHIHAFYIEQLTDILQRLSLNQTAPDLFVSVRNEEDAAKARDQLSGYAGQVKKIEVFPNKGRDIGPFLTGFGADLAQDYEVIGHIHTKKSLFSSNTAWVDDWVNYTFSNLLGGTGSGAMADRIFEAMDRDPDVGIIYPDDPHIPGWGVNRTEAEKLAPLLGVNSLPESFNFPIGTMFWMRSRALKPFVDLGLTWDDYPAEPIPNDGTMLHALERLFGVVPAQTGWKTHVTHTRGISR